MGLHYEPNKVETTEYNLKVDSLYIPVGLRFTVVG